MGKFVKKARGVGSVIEVVTQGQLGVRTRARAQAIEKRKDLITSNRSNDHVSSSTSAKSFAPSQISYLELRSRRLEKTVGRTVCCTANKAPSARKSNSAEEFRKLSDLTNSDILADDSSRFALSAEGARHTHSQTNYGACDENRDTVYHFYGDNEVEEELLLHGCIRSFQQWGSRGRGPPSVAQSRSNSRSNSVTRELPPPTHELQPRGILTRNQRKMEKQSCENSTNEVVDMDARLDLFGHASEHLVSSNRNSCLARNVDVKVMNVGENVSIEGWFANDRLTGEETPINYNMPSFSGALLPELAACSKEAAPFEAVSPLDMEIENFFLQAEQQVQKHFTEQYNFDPVTETPLLGRYDWVSL